MKEIILALAKEAGVSPDSFKKWKSRRCVPHRYRHDLIELARKKGADLDAADLDWRVPRRRKARPVHQEAA